MTDAKDSQCTNQAYKALLGQWRLASEQIYSRFATMLTANSIVVASIVLSAREDWPKLVPVILAIAGVFLCTIWVLFNILGIKTEKEIIEKVRKIEEKHIAQEGLRVVIHGYRGFDILSLLTIVVFIFIYVSLFFFHIIHNIDYFQR